MKIISSALIMLFILLIAFIAFLFQTTPGLYTSIRLAKLFIPGTLHVSGLKGTLRNEFSISELRYQQGTTSTNIKNLQVSLKIASLLHPELTLNKVTATKMIIHNNDSASQLNDLRLTGRIQQKQITIESLKFKYQNNVLHTQLQMDRQPPYQLSGTIKLNPVGSKATQLKGTLSLGGTLNHLQWTGEVQGPAKISLQGSLEEYTKLNQVIKWTQFNWQNSPQNKVSSPEGRIVIFGTLPNLTVHSSAKIIRNNEAHWQMQTSIQGTLPWQWTMNIQLLQNNSNNSRQPGLYSTVSLQGRLRDKNKGTFKITIAPGHYQMPADSALASLHFEGGAFKGTLSPGSLATQGHFTIDANKKIALALTLPDFTLDKTLSGKQSVAGELTLLINSLDFLKGFNPQISDLDGQLSATLKAKGTLANLPVESKIILSKGKMTIPELGLHLYPIELTVNAKNQIWDAKGAIGSANNSLTLSGQGTFIPELKGELAIKGTNFPIANTNEYQIHITPLLNLLFTPSSMNITGSLLIPSAKIKPQSFSNSLGASEDIVLSRRETESPRTAFNTSMNVNIAMGEEVELTFKGLHAVLAGTVNVTQKPQGPINANGELNVTHGEYKAYGQELAVEQGELMFTGGRLNNPGINLRAQKKIETSTSDITSANQFFDFNNNNLQTANLQGGLIVGVEVTGRLTSPKIMLFSTPPVLSQADILSMLVLGRPASQANKAGGQLLLAAISSMNLGNGTNGTQLIEQLKQKLGFDLNVQTNSSYNLATNQFNDNTSVVVGKSLSKRIYLSYNVGLSQSDPNVLTLKYLLNKFLSIQISSSTTGNGIDVLYTSSTNKDKS